MNEYKVTENGYYGDFGGTYVPEMLYKNVETLQKNYQKILDDETFQKEFKDILEEYCGRPTPLTYAKRLSEYYSTNIFLKREDLNHSGSHKLNNAVGQILIAQRMGKTRIIAETGAGQHGVAVATVCALKGLKCIVYMGEVDIKRQAPNVKRMQMLGAEVIPAKSGSRTLKDATNEAIRDWIANPQDTYYLIGSAIGPHPYPDLVAKLQSIISKEIKAQFIKKTGKDFPDAIIACVGGGSNAIGSFYHFLDTKNTQLFMAEAGGLGVDTGESAATSVLGSSGVIHGCKTILMQDSDGQIIEPYSISAGLDYPGIGPIHAHLLKTKRAIAFSINDDEALKAGFLLTQKEGIIPALESAHALAVLDKVKFEKNQNIVITVSGRGDKDLETYIENMENKNDK